jgi:hypothetical protein
MNPQKPTRLTTFRWAGLAVVLWVLLVPSRARAGTWTPVANNAPGPVNGMLLLSDGTVMAEEGDASTTYYNTWYRLTPDTNGSYVNGNWTTLNSMHDTRLYCSSEVLTDGRVYIAGGEYGSGGRTAEIYNPLHNSWIYTAAGNGGYGDGESELLPDGTVLQALVGWLPWPTWANLIYNPFTNGWSDAGSSYEYQDEASWVKLPDGSILTIDPYNDSNGLNSERFIPGTAWVQDANPKVALFSTYSETGPAFMLADGLAFFLGGTGHTLFYTPTGDATPGQWAQGPDIPNGMVMQDAAGAMMINGKILCAVSQPMTGPKTWVQTTYFYVYDPVANTFDTNVASPTGGATDNVYSYVTMMLDLPSGTVLYSHCGSDLYVYQPDGPPLPAGKPSIQNVGWNTDGTVELIGTGLNGISEGADYGDDFQPHSNYPLVRFSSGGGVYYGTTFNWSSTGIMTGTNLVSTQFTVSPNMPPGSASMVVIANGFVSETVPFEGPVWVDFSHTSGTMDGSHANPYATLAQGVSAVASGGSIALNASMQPSTSSETIAISKPMTIMSEAGPSTIGQ